MTNFGKATGGRSLYAIAFYASWVLLAKVFVSILLEYRWYFPPNFEASAFLLGRQEIFNGLNATAFYAHIVSGPAALLLLAWLMLSGGRTFFGLSHAWLGRLQGMVVVLIVVPSGLVMACHTLAGPLAGWGFATLAVLTAASTIAAGLSARARQFQAHRKWAVRCCILLCSPLLLRIATGWAIVLGLESQLFYISNAWLSWLVPLAIYELTQRVPSRHRVKVALADRLPVTS